MTTDIDAASYALYERVIREARPASVYDVKVTEMAWGRTLETTNHVSGTDKDNLPWGQVGKISKATWYTGKVSKFFSPEPNAWTLTIRHHGYYPGLTVSVMSGLFNEFQLDYTLIGVAGRMKCPNGQGNLAVESEDALVARVVADIEKFYKAHAEEEYRMMNDPQYDDGGESWNRLLHGDGVEY